MAGVSDQQPALPPKLSVRERKRLGLTNPPKPRPRVKPKPEPSPTPRALDYDEAMLKRAELYVEQEGMYPHDAWVLAGGNARTWQRYEQKARYGVQPYVDIVDRLTVATAKHLQQMVKLVTGVAAKKMDARTLKDMLQARHRQWGPRVEVALLTDPQAQLLFQIFAELTSADIAEQAARVFQQRVEGLETSGQVVEGGGASGGGLPAAEGQF